MDMLGTSPCVSAVSRAAPATATSEDEIDLRRGPWTVEEDVLLMDYITLHGEGRWNSLARRAGLKRTGKSCRLRWLNYLRPDVRRGNITPEEQLLILELHFRWGNRWSKIARHLPGRTDNEIKNYWRTRVQKHARQLKCDVNSERFRDVMRHLWMPRLVERIQADYGVAAATAAANSNTTAVITTAGSPCAPPQGVYQSASNYVYTCNPPSQVTMTGPDTSSMVGSSSEASLREKLQSIPAMTEGVAAWSRVQCGSTSAMNSDMIHSDMFGESWSELLASAGDDGSTGLPDFGLAEFRDSLWNSDDNDVDMSMEEREA